MADFVAAAGSLWTISSLSVMIQLSEKSAYLAQKS